MKVVVIGCTHAGTAAILNTAALYPDAHITVYERNDNISFLSCGIALYVGGVVEDPKGLFYCSPEVLAEKGVVTRMQHNVLDVDVDNKSVKVENLLTGETFNDTFDKLIVTTGSWPIVPRIPGIELENILLSKNYQHANTIIDKTKEAKKVVVVGAGYIGVELVEAFRENGKEVVLIDAVDRIMNKYLDKEFTDPAEAAFKEHGIQLRLGEMVERFEGENGKVTRVVTNKYSYEADLVIMCVGFRPNTELFKNKLDMLENGALIVDAYMRTSNPDIYAAGDSAAIYYNPTRTHGYIPLATNAIRMGLLVAKNLKTPTIAYMGTQSTSGIKIYDLNIAATGMTLETAQSLGFHAAEVTIEDSYRPEFMPTHEKVMLRIVYDQQNRKILGAQVSSKLDMTQIANTVSVAIQKDMTIEEMAFVDFFFQPHFNKPWNLLNLAAMKAL